MGSNNVDCGCRFVVGVLEFFGKVQTEQGHGSHKDLEWNGNNASGAIATYNSWEVSPEPVSKVSVWVELDKQRARRSNLPYFYSGSSSAPGESDNLTYIIFYYDFLAFILSNVCAASLTVGDLRPPVGLAPFHVCRFPWATYSDHSSNYNALISKVLITSLMGFHIRLQVSSGYFGWGTHSP